MGVENNNAVLATTWDDEAVARIKEWIAAQPAEWRSLFAVVATIMNGRTTVVLCPDGGKEGWKTSNAGDDLRQRFIAELTSNDYEFGSSPWDWVEIGYGEYGQKILRGNNANCYSGAGYAIAT